MSALFLSYYFPPMQYPQSIQIGRLSAHLDRQIDVFCGIDRNGPVDTEMPAARRGVVVHRLPWSGTAWMRWRIRRTLLGYRFLRPDAYRGWAMDAADEILNSEKANRWSTLVTFGQPMSDHIAGLRICERLKIPWIVHLSDPWVDNPYWKSWALERRINRRFEEEVFGAADKIVVTSDETAEMIKSWHPSDKVVVVPHSFDPADIPVVSPEKANEGPIVVRHVGNFYGPRTPGPLFEALTLLGKRDHHLADHLRVELIGSTAKKVNIQSFGLPDGLVAMIPPVSYQRSLGLMRSADLLLNIDAPAATSVFLPSKLVDYIGVRRPIVAITPPGTSQRLVEKLGGWVADPSDPQAIADRLTTAIDWVSAHRGEDWGDDEVRAGYHVVVVAKRFGDLMDELGGRGSLS